MSSKLSIESARKAAAEALEISVVKGIVLNKLENRTSLGRDHLIEFLNGYDWRFFRPTPEATESVEAFEAFVHRAVQTIERSISSQEGS